MFALAVQFQKLASLGKFDLATGKTMSLELVVRPPCKLHQKACQEQQITPQGCSPAGVLLVQLCRGLVARVALLWMWDKWKVCGADRWCVGEDG